jgi:hypothetical protein
MRPLRQKAPFGGCRRLLVVSFPVSRRLAFWPPPFLSARQLNGSGGNAVHITHLSPSLHETLQAVKPLREMRAPLS